MAVSMHFHAAGRDSSLHPKIRIWHWPHHVNGPIIIWKRALTTGNFGCGYVIAILKADGTVVTSQTKCGNPGTVQVTAVGGSSHLIQDRPEERR